MTDSRTAFKAGFIAILGWTNVGKSTLLNRLTGMKIAIATHLPQTTRHRIQGIVQGDGYQAIFVDTPGIHAPVKELSRRMIKAAWGAVEAADVILLMLFPDKPAQMQLEPFIDALKTMPAPVVVAINKIDTVKTHRLLPLIDAINNMLKPAEIVPISALSGENVSRLLDALVAHLPEGEPFYDEDEVTDKSERFIIAEIIREKIMLDTRQEIPYITAVEVESFREMPEKGIVEISAVIYVEKSSQKGIIIGREGSRLKRVGTLARKEIESFLQMKAVLKLWVKVAKDWRNDLRHLKRWGIMD